MIPHRRSDWSRVRVPKRRVPLLAERLDAERDIRYPADNRVYFQTVDKVRPSDGSGRSSQSL